MMKYLRQMTEFLFNILDVVLAYGKRAVGATLHVFRVLTPLLPYIFLAEICVCADYLLLLPEVSRNNLSRALTDNVSHGIIGAISWFIVVGLKTRKDILEGIICGLMASAIDIDHFIAARSLTLEDALSLQNRPIFHTTTIVPVIAPILQVWIAQNVASLKMLPYMFIVAVVSHHLRDGQRRGLWFWPIGSTPPLPYWLYITFELALPCVMAQVLETVESLPDVKQIHTEDV